MAKVSTNAVVATPTANRKFLIFAVLLVLLTFPHASFEFGFKFTDGDDDGTATQAVTKRRGVIDRKFKFRKIERISLEDDDDDDDDDNDDDDGNGNNKNENVNNHLGGGDDDDEDDDAEDSDDSDEGVAKRESRSTHAAATISKTKEVDEFQFERVHKAKRDKEKTSSHVKKQVTPAGGSKATSKEETEDESSFFGDLFSGWFGGGETDADDQVKKKRKTKGKSKSRNGADEGDDDDDDDDDNDDDNAKKATKTNSIIDWLKWFNNKAGKTKPAAPKPTSITDNWLSYLNRWPFNSLIPFDKPAKPSKPSRRGATRHGNGNGDDDDDDSNCDSAAATEPMSQEHFESLLHTLPGFVVNASHVSDIECKRQMQIFHHQLRGNKLWTLQMLDATGKITSGLLRGNINQFGDFDLCTQVKTVVKVKPEIPIRVRGKYCMAHIETQTDVPELKVPLHLAHGRALWNSHLDNPGHFVPRYAIANWGICIPHLCSGTVVEEMIETNLRPYNRTGVEFHIEVNDNDCYVRQSKRSIAKLLKKDEKFLMVILYIGMLLFLMIATLIMDYWLQLMSFIQNKLGWKAESSEAAEQAENATENDPQKQEEQTTESEKRETEIDAEATIVKSDVTTSFKHLINEIFKSFSPRSTLTVLLSRESNDLKFPIFHVLKLGATIMLYVCLKYLMIGHLPITNRDKLLNTVEQPLSISYRSPMIYSDVLLLLSGFLTAYQLSEEMEQQSCINVLKRLAAKILRYLPTVYLVLLFQTWLLPYLGSGPLWTNLVGQQANLCKQHMWRNMLSVQNAVDLEESCSPMTIQLALEMQLYLLGPLIVWLYHTDSDAGFFIYGAIHAMSVAARYSRTNREHLSMTLFHGMNVSKFYRSANMLYSSPISRATPYLLGIGGGILHRSQAGELDISAKFIPFGWLVSAISIIWCLWSPSSGMRSDYVYSASESAAYASWSPLILGMALVWIIFMFPRDEDSFLNALCSTRPVLFLSRISFPLQLVTYLVVVYNTASIRDSSKFQISDLFDLNEIVCICIVATLIALLIDVPAQNIRRLLVNRLFRPRPQQEHGNEEPTSGGEQSEGEISEERSDKVACDTPEPTETVWASDPEEEEQKYLARRRSSTTQPEETNKTIEKASKNADDADEEEEDEEEDEDDISEDEEVKLRPASPKLPEPTKPEVAEAPKSTYTRRRRPTED